MQVSEAAHCLAQLAQPVAVMHSVERAHIPIHLAVRLCQS
jgi:hypothetical protein